MSKREAKKLSSSKKAKKAFSVVSLFSGYGGLDLGFAGGFAYRKWAFDKNLFQMVFAKELSKNKLIQTRILWG